MGGFLESVDWPTAFTNALLIAILVELAQINGKVGRK